MGDPRVTEAFTAMPRQDFLPPREVRFAGVDRALPIGHGQTNSQPSTVRRLLDLLGVAPGHRVLDVGCGSGWTTALLGHLVGPGGSVVGVEIVPELVTFGRANVARHPMPWVRIRAAEEGVLGLPEEAPFDRILCSAEASSVPEELVSQLAPGGVLVLPVRGRLLEVRRSSEAGEPTVVRHGHYSFVPLIEPSVRPEGSGSQ